MPPRSHRRNARAPRRRTGRSRRRFRFAAPRRFVRSRWQECRTFLRALGKTTPAVRIVVSAALLLVLWLAVNWTYHAFNKPTEVLFPLDNALDKSPGENLAGVRLAVPRAFHGGHNAGVPRRDGAGRRRRQPGGADILALATDVESPRVVSARVERGRHVPDHQRGVPGRAALLHSRPRGGRGRPLERLQSCWFNSLYTRTIPSHAIELTSATLDRSVANTLARHRIARATLRQKQDLAAVIHLCGPGTGHAYARRGFSDPPASAAATTTSGSISRGSTA